MRLHYDQLAESFSKQKERLRKFFRNYFMTEEEKKKIKPEEDTPEDTSDENLVERLMNSGADEESKEEEIEDDEIQDDEIQSDEVEDDKIEDETLFSGVHDLFETPEEKREREEIEERKKIEEKEEKRGIIFESIKQEREDELEELKNSGAVINEKIKLKEKEIALNNTAQSQLTKEIIKLGKEVIRLKKLQINIKKENQTEGLQKVEEEIKTLENEIKLREEEINLRKKETEFLQVNLGKLKSQFDKTEDNIDDKFVSDADEQPNGYVIDEDYNEYETKGNEILEKMQEKIINRLSEPVRAAIANWNDPDYKEDWEKYTRKDLINLFKRLDKRNSIFLKKGYIEKLDVKRLVLLMHQSKSPDDTNEFNELSGLTRDERLQYMLQKREETKNKWDSRTSQENDYDKEFYDIIEENLPLGEDQNFLAAFEGNRDHMFNMVKLANSVSDFKLRGANPLGEFKKNIKETVHAMGTHLVNLHQTYEDMREKINAALKKDPTLKKNPDLKRYHDIWLKHLQTKNVEEFKTEDIAPLLVDEKYDYLTKIEDITETMLDELWESGYDPSQNQVKLNPKKQAIIKYFSEFLKKLNNITERLRRIKIDRSDEAELEEIRRENKYKDDYRNKTTTKINTKPSALGEVSATDWHDLRLQGRMYALILTTFHNENIKKLEKETKTKLYEIRKKIVSQFLGDLQRHFDTRGIVPNMRTTLKNFEKELRKCRLEIVRIPGMSADKLDKKIKEIMKNEELTKEIKEENYKLPEFQQIPKTQ